MFNNQQLPPPHPSSVFPWPLLGAEESSWPARARAPPVMSKTRMQKPQDQSVETAESPRIDMRAFENLGGLVLDPPENPPKSSEDPVELVQGWFWIPRKILSILPILLQNPPSKSSFKILSILFESSFKILLNPFQSFSRCWGWPRWS